MARTVEVGENVYIKDNLIPRKRYGRVHFLSTMKKGWIKVEEVDDTKILFKHGGCIYSSQMIDWNYMDYIKMCTVGSHYED